MWTTAQRQKRSNDLILMLALNQTIDQLAMANSVRWHGHVLRREDDCEYGSLRLKMKGGNEGQKGHGRSRLRKRVQRLA